VRLITVYTLAYNEELLIQFMIDHYRSKFPNCHIVIYDNSSTDKTVEIARANGCEIRTYNSGGTLNDGLHMQIKNTCWKDAKTDWVLICDLDELLDISEEQLKQEEAAGTTIIKSDGWSMINLENNCDFRSLKYALKEWGYDKNMLFNKKYISDICYSPGCHDSRPTGNVRLVAGKYRMYHYKYLSPDLLVDKFKITAQRLSSDNKKYGWGSKVLKSEKEVREYFEEKRKLAVKIF